MTISIILSLILITPIARIFIDTAAPNALKDPDGATDLRFPPYSNYATLIEGFSHGNFNNEGYNNLFNYENGMSIDILLMGTSHMQGCNVMPQENAANKLISLSGKKVYNIGMGTHFFPICVRNLPPAIKKYKPSQYVVIESTLVNFSEQELNNMLSFDVPKVTYNISLGENVGVFRTFYRKYIRDGLQNISKAFTSLYLIKRNVFLHIRNFLVSNYPSEQQEKELPYVPTNPILLSQILKQMSETVKDAGAKLIIAYHPSVALNKDGSLKIEGNPEDVKIFAEACEQNGIYFIDMSERFLSEYEKNYTLPNGFFNTSIGMGHLNKNGHRMFAEEIYKLMQRIEVK